MQSEKTIDMEFLKLQFMTKPISKCCYCTIITILILKLVSWNLWDLITKKVIFSLVIISYFQLLTFSQMNHPA